MFKKLDVIEAQFVGATAGAHKNFEFFALNILVKLVEGV